MSSRNNGKRTLKKSEEHADNLTKRRCARKDLTDKESLDDGNLEENDVIKRENDKVPAKFLNDVLSVYESILNRYKDMISTDGLAIYQKVLAERPIKKYTAKTKIKPLKLDAPKDEPTSFVIRSQVGTVLQKCPVHYIEHVMATPRMQYWTLTEMNILCEDERTLSHIPFLEGEGKDDEAFVKELLKTFEQGIHGTKPGCGYFINDHTLYSLLKNLEAHCKDADSKLKYRAISELFPNKAPAQQLPFLYEDLKRRFDPGDENTKNLLMEHYNDGKALHSFQLLLCPRCFTYDCLLHGVNPIEAEVKRRRSSIIHQACGPHCFRTAIKEMEEARRRPISPNNKNVDASLYLKIENDTWTVQQETMFAILRRTFKNDICKITEILNLISQSGAKKRCKEVYAFSFRTAPISPRGDVSPGSSEKKRNMRDQHRTFRAVKWAKTEGKVGNRHVYEPCSHLGPCTIENGCSCVIIDNLCTKFCRCGDQCRYKFPGCRCAPGLCRTKQCQCFYASWECDPDTCKSCKCDNLDQPSVATCKNVSIQRGLQKMLVIAPSQVAGWGCFTEEDVEKNDFIAEYCGEVISHDESERRGKIYDKLKCSYLFGLNDEMVVDATRKGNVIRFANHSKDPNCMAKVFMVNGDHRIGIFAKRSIAAGEELFFDYSYNSYQQVKFVSKERPRPV